jgi:hypothetical protein
VSVGTVSGTTTSLVGNGVVSLVSEGVVVTGGSVVGGGSGSGAVVVVRPGSVGMVT